MNNHKAEFDFNFYKKEIKPNVLFPISIGQKYLQGDKFEAIITAANEQCGKIRFIPVLQTHAKKMWLNADDKSAYQKANKDRNLWLVRTKEARSKLKIEDKDFKLPADNYSVIKSLENDPRCWEYWLVQSEAEKLFVEDRYLTNSHFQNLIDNAVLAYCKAILIKSGINIDDLPKGDKEFYMEHAKDAIIDELGVMKKWQTAFAGQYDCMAYPISETNIENSNGDVIRGIGALVVDCFYGLFDKKSDIKFPIIDINIQSQNLRKLNQKVNNNIASDLVRAERRNTIPKTHESPLSPKATRFIRSKSLSNIMINNTNSCAPAVDYDDTSSQSSDISLTTLSANNSNCSSLSSSPDNNPEILSFTVTNSNKVMDTNNKKLLTNELKKKPVNEGFKDSEKVVAVLPVSVHSINGSKSDHTIADHINMFEQEQTVLVYLEEESKLSVKDVVQGIVQKIEQSDDMNLKRISRLAAFTRFLLEPPVEQIQPTNIATNGSSKKTNSYDNHTYIYENKAIGTSALNVQPSNPTHTKI